METTPNPVAKICAYSRCGKPFIPENPRKLHCTNSCRVRKSRANTQHIKSADAIKHPTTTSPINSQGLSDEQFNELKNLILKRAEKEQNDSSSIDLMRVVESGLGYLTGKAALSILGTSSLEDKVDYLIKLVVHLLDKDASRTTNKSAIQGIRPITPSAMPILPPKPILQVNQKISNPRTQPRIQSTQNNGIHMPKENLGIKQIVNPFPGSELMM